MSRALALAAVALCAGCGSLQMGKALEAGRTVVNAAEPCFEAQQNAQIAECDHDPPCEEKVLEDWKPVADALDAFRSLWCALDASQCAPAPVAAPIVAPPAPQPAKPTPAPAEPKLEPNS